ncbi:GNAT family N-acetyltransferase [Euzebya tangerina]|uniref:GNAT family N-acetyltransferase n=1 Tax=Euzebya tangerina TaxID=591198 RepID=UPI000E318A8B|nr:GNAT family N-acetyltransferase [Euzebya tangerina]
MTRGDVPACVALVNHIIAVGGTTAYEAPFTDHGFADRYLGDAAITTVVLEGGRLVGFQGAFEVERGIFSLGTFTDQQRPVPGAGRALFDATVMAARARGGVRLLAKITSDNAGGLAFYTAMGFIDDHVVPADHTRPDGTAVDRIVKVYPL